MTQQLYKIIQETAADMEMPILTFLQNIGVSNAKYYAWKSGKTHPNPSSLEAAMRNIDAIKNRDKDMGFAFVGKPHDEGGLGAIAEIVNSNLSDKRKLSLLKLFLSAQ